MHVKVHLVRQAGRRLPWREVINLPPLAGALRMYRVAYGSGSVTVLELRDPGNQTEEGSLATLYEPVLLDLGNDRMVFRGFERQRTENGTIGLAQEWRCEVV